jgi:hypothetical protein
MDNNNSNNNDTKSTMDVTMSGKNTPYGSQWSLDECNTTAAFSQMNLMYLQFSMLGMKEMGRMNEWNAYDEIYARWWTEQPSSPPSSTSKIMVPENCIIIQGGVLQCRDIHPGSYSVAKWIKCIVNISDTCVLSDMH